MKYHEFLSPRNHYNWIVGKWWQLRSGELKVPIPHALLKELMNQELLSIEWPRSYGWPLGFTWLDPIRSGLMQYVPLRQVDIPQPHNTVMRFCLVCNRQKHSVVIDYTDLPERIYSEYLNDCLLYFKMQYRLGGYGDTRIVPGLYVPSPGLKMYSYLPRLRWMRDNCDGGKIDVYGRFGLYAGADVRVLALKKLEEQQAFRFKGGGKRIALVGSLKEVASSKVCVDLPGRGPFCHRLVDYMAIGSCIVSYPHFTAFHRPLVHGEHIAYCKSDLTDLIELCQYYLTHDEERRGMIQASRAYFDEYLHKDRIAAYYLESLLARLNGVRENP